MSSCVRIVLHLFQKEIAFAKGQEQHVYGLFGKIGVSQNGWFIMETL